MKHYETRTCKSFLTILRANIAYQTAITELTSWRQVVKVIESLDYGYTEEQLAYAMKKDWLKGFKEASAIVLKLNQNPINGMVASKIMSDIYDFGIPLDSGSETTQFTLNSLLNRHSENGTSEEARARKPNGEPKYKKLFRVVDITEKPRRYKLIDIK